MKKNVVVVISFISALGVSFWTGGFISTQKRETNNRNASDVSSNKNLDTKSKIYSETQKPTQPSFKIKTFLAKNTTTDSNLEETPPTLSNNIQHASPYDVMPIAEPINDSDETLVNPSVSGNEQAFFEEGVDVEWAFDAESEMWAKFEESQFQNSAMESVECRETLCKVDIAHEDVDARTFFLEKLVSKLDEYQGMVQHYEDESGRRMTRLYRFR